MALTDGLVALWHMNNDWLDSSGNGNNGTAYAGATFDTTNQKLGIASGKFDGIDDYTNVGNGSSINLYSTMSFSFWMRPSNWYNNLFFGMVSKYKATTDTDQYRVGKTASYYGYTDGVLVFTYVSGSSSWQNILDTSGVSYTNSQWYHIVVIVNTTSNIVSFYRNGQLLSEVSCNFSTYPMSSSSGNAYIGAHYGGITGATHNGLFPGLIDELALWNRAITTDEIAQLYNSGNGMEIGAATNSGLFAIL